LLIINWNCFQTSRKWFSLQVVGNDIE
jgi:hypothetical protein